MRHTHTLFCLFLFADVKEVNNFRSFERSELEHKLSFLAIAVIPGETKVMLSACDVA